MAEREKDIMELTLNPFFSFLLQVVKTALSTGWATSLNLAISLYIGETKLGTVKLEGDAKLHPFEVK